MVYQIGDKSEARVIKNFTVVIYIFYNKLERLTRQAFPAKSNVCGRGQRLYFSHVRPFYERAVSNLGP